MLSLFPKAGDPRRPSLAPWVGVGVRALADPRLGRLARWRLTPLSQTARLGRLVAPPRRGRTPEPLVSPASRVPSLRHETKNLGNARAGRTPTASPGSLGGGSYRSLRRLVLPGSLRAGRVWLSQTARLGRLAAPPRRGTRSGAARLARLARTLPHTRLKIQKKRARGRRPPPRPACGRLRRHAPAGAAALPGSRQGVHSPRCQTCIEHTYTYT